MDNHNISKIFEAVLEILQMGPEQTSQACIHVETFGGGIFVDGQVRNAFHHLLYALVYQHLRRLLYRQIQNVTTSGGKTNNTV